MDNMFDSVEDVVSGLDVIVIEFVMDQCEEFADVLIVVIPRNEVREGALPGIKPVLAVI